MNKTNHSNNILQPYITSSLNNNSSSLGLEKNDRTHSIAVPIIHEKNSNFDAISSTTSSYSIFQSHDSTSPRSSYSILQSHDSTSSSSLGSTIHFQQNINNRVSNNRTVVRRNNRSYSRKIEMSMGMNICAEAGDIKGAKEIFNDALHNPTITLNNHFYNILIKAYVKAGEVNEGLDVLKEFKAKKLPLCVISYNTLIYGFGQEGDIDKALDLFEEMKQDNITPTESTYRIIIGIYLSKNRFDEAISIYNQHLKNRKSFKNSQLFQILKQQTSSPTNDLSETTQKEYEAQFNPGLTNLALIQYNKKIAEFAKSGNIIGATNIYREVLERDINPNTTLFNTLIKTYMVAGKITHVDAVLKLMENAKVEFDVITYNTLMSGWIMANNPIKAISLFDEMKNAGLKYSCISLSLLMKAYIKTNNLDQALTVYDEIKKKGLLISVERYANLINFCIREHNTAQVFAIYNDMKEAKIKQNNSIFSLIIEAYVLEDRFDEAIALYLKHFPVPEKGNRINLHDHFSLGHGFIKTLIFLQKLPPNSTFAVITGQGLYRADHESYKMYRFVWDKLEYYYKLNNKKITINPNLRNKGRFTVSI